MRHCVPHKACILSPYWQGAVGAGGHREVGEAAHKEITIITRVARGRLLGFLISTSLAPWGGRGGLVVSPPILCLSDVGPHGRGCGAARDQRRVPGVDPGPGVRTLLLSGVSPTVTTTISLGIFPSSTKNLGAPFGAVSDSLLVQFEGTQFHFYSMAL